MMTGTIHHYPNYSFQDDGFGKLIMTTLDQFNMNYVEYILGGYEV